jgi:hypothetical protein
MCFPLWTAFLKIMHLGCLVGWQNQGKNALQFGNMHAVNAILDMVIL